MAGERADNDAAKGAPTKDNAMYNIIVTYGYMALWIFLSAAVIMLNKYVLSYAHFPYPIALTLTHMGFCSTLAFILVSLKVTEPIKMETETYLRCVVPIAGLFAGTLWLGNAAYLYLSVSFIQMIKALMPMCVFSMGCLFGTERFTSNMVGILATVTVGVAIASYGELHFNLLGVVMQGSSLLTESTRLVLIQILLQQRGIKLNPITTLYYIAPACFAFLTIPFLAMELPAMRADPKLVIRPGLLLVSAAAAFALNLSVFLLIGKSSALTMNVAGVIKDWMLIFLSILLYGSSVTGLQYFGYGLSFLGVTYYNYMKIQATMSGGGGGASAGKGVALAGRQADPERLPMLRKSGNGSSEAALGYDDANDKNGKV